MRGVGDENEMDSGSGRGGLSMGLVSLKEKWEVIGKQALVSKFM